MVYISNASDFLVAMSQVWEWPAGEGHQLWLRREMHNMFATCGSRDPFTKSLQLEILYIGMPVKRYGEED